MVRITKPNQRSLSLVHIQRSRGKTLLEKLSLIKKLEDKEKQAFYSIMDALIFKKN